MLQNTDCLTKQDRQQIVNIIEIRSKMSRSKKDLKEYFKKNKIIELVNMVGKECWVIGLVETDVAFYYRIEESYIYILSFYSFISQKLNTTIF